MEEARQRMQGYKLARLAGKAALVVRFVMEYIAPLPAYDEVAKKLKKKCANALNEEFMASKVHRIQQFLHRRIIRKRWRIQYAEQMVKKHLAQRERAAEAIQGLIRMFLGKCLVVRLAQTRYNKFFDGEVKREYWFNPITKRSFWEKPRLLGRLDCGVAIKIPDQNEQFVIQCSVCTFASSNCICDECDEAFCTPCFEHAHRGGKRKAHTKLPLSCCVQCEYQTGTRMCLQCKDMYCDSCYTFAHLKGRLRLHTFTWCCQVCVLCEERAARWTRTDPTTGIPSIVCNVCHEASFGKPQGSPHSKPLPFLGKALAELRERQAEERAKEAVQEQFHRRKEILLQQARERAAVNIQRVWRGRHKVWEIQDFLEERRRFLGEC